MTARPGIARAVVLVALLGCGHSAPFTTPDDRGTSPFAALVPTRLTYDAGADIHPQWSTDGRAILYTFERQLPGSEFPDRCLGALPAAGGQRIGEWCWSSHDEATRRDGIEAGALSEDGRLFFVHHHGAGTKQPNPHKGSAYLASADAIGSPVRLFDVLVAPPGASARWDYFLAPVFTGPDEVTGLAAAVRIEVPCRDCAWDTTYSGLDLVRVDLRAPDSHAIIARIGRATFLSWDREADRFFFARDGRIETVPTRGGEATMVWQVPRSPDRGQVEITGVAAGGGRLAVTFRWFEQDTLHNILGVITPEGDVQQVAFATHFPRYEEIALSPDGRRLVVERRDGNGERDLFLYELP